MGEYADEVQNGGMCQFCGQMFIDGGDGYPRTCQSCIEDGMEEHKDQALDLDNTNHKEIKNGNN